MLQNIRDKAQGWIAYGIVILISIPFALWGIQQYLGGGSEPVAATVNGVEITERALDNQFQNFRQQLRAQMGAAYRPELIDDERLRREVLNRMIQEELIQQASRDMGLRVSDTMVQATLFGIEDFQKDGRFDEKAFERSARQQGYSKVGYMEYLRSAMLTQQLPEAVVAATFVTPYEVSESLRLMKQQRELSYFVIPAADYRVEGEIPDDQVERYYEANQAQFIIPERVKLEYILLNSQSAGETVEVDEERLRGFYEANPEKFGRPEQRKVSHILITVPEDTEPAAVDAARQKIDALAVRLAQGEDFAELAKNESQDPGTAANGGDLGYFGRGGGMDPAFEAAAFAQPMMTVGEPVRSRFGFHLIKVTGIKKADVKPFEEAKAEVESLYRKAEGEKRYYEMAERLADLSYEDPNSLEPAAKELGLKVELSDWITRETAAPPLAAPKVRAAAFSEDVLQEHHNSEPIEIDTDVTVVVRVAEHEEEGVQPLKEVRERILTALRQENAEAQAKAEAEKRLQELNNGSPLEQVAADLAVTGPVKVMRSDRQLPAELNESLFRTAKPVEGKPVPGMARLGNGDYALFALLSVTEGSADENSDKMQGQKLRNQLQRGFFNELIADLKLRADIEILLKQEAE